MEPGILVLEHNFLAIKSKQLSILATNSLRCQCLLKGLAYLGGRTLVLSVSR